MDLSKRRECQCAVPDAYSVETFPGMRTTLLQAQSEAHRHVVWEENSELYYLLVLTGAASAAKYLRMQFREEIAQAPTGIPGSILPPSIIQILCIKGS